MKRCVLHLGMPKTASTSIQNTLYNNNSLLKDYGWEYPLFYCPEQQNIFVYHNNPLCRMFHQTHRFHSLRPAINGTIDLEVQKKGLLQQLETYCRKSSKIILSSEALLQNQALQRILDFMSTQEYEIEAIVYVRTPFSYRVSVYQSLVKFSQLARSVIHKNLQNFAVQNPVSTAQEVFGDKVKFYPFNYLCRSGVDIVEHFMSLFLEPEQCENIDLVKKKANKSLSWQALDLLAYIEEQSPFFVDDIKNEERRPKDIKPLWMLEGEKFKFMSDQLESFHEVINQENNWLRDNLGNEFCDQDYQAEVSTEPLTWNETSIYSILKIYPKLNSHIQTLIRNYINNKANFSSYILKIKALLRIYRIMTLNYIKGLPPFKSKYKAILKKII